jgi:long-chain fatty acid transport protein
VHRPLRYSAAALLIGLASPALATNGMRMIGFSPTQNAMGGVGVGATLDSGTVLTNPAGMTELGRQLDVSVTWFKPDVDYTATGANPAFANAGVKYTTDRGGSVIPNLGVVLPLGGGFTAGIGAFGVGGMGVDYKPGLYNGGNPGDRGTLTSYQNLRVAPAIAYKFGDMFSAGVAVNVSWAQMKYDVASGFLQATHDTANSFGLGGTLGLKFTPLKDLTFGVAYETKSDFQDFEFKIPAHTASDGQGGTYPAPGGTDKLAFDQPAVATAGVAYRVVPAVLVAFDVEWINWSDVMGKNQPKYTNNTQATGSMPFDMSWDDQVVYKIGVEWAASKDAKIRAGFDYGKNPLKADRAFENIAFPAVAESHVTLGLGWNVSDALAINVGGMYSPKVTVSGANAAQQGLLAYSTSMSQYSIDLGLGWKF